MYTSVSFKIENLDLWKQRLLFFASQNQEAIYLDSHGEQDQLFSFDGLLAYSPQQTIQLNSSENSSSFEVLKEKVSATKSWWFGYLGYDLKNELEDLESNNSNVSDFPDLFFFEAGEVVILNGDYMTVHSISDPHEVYSKLSSVTTNDFENYFCCAESLDVQIQHRVSKNEYLETIRAIKKHIQLGDIYEMNYCMEFYIENIDLEPHTYYHKLNQLAKAPFSSYLQFGEYSALCGSPERFIKKQGNKVISQPIKGTRKRLEDIEKDNQIKDQLFNDPKDRAENVMIVDLVRNDLSKVCKAGTVKVEELFGIYSFEYVHQMISTVVGELEEDVHPVDLITATFPMGSMTGAPKVKSMELIEQFEKTKRGLYSGAIGYFTPMGDFDFNVVIRSLLYNSRKKYLSFEVGGAIVHGSVPEDEYDECLVKSASMLKTLL